MTTLNGLKILDLSRVLAGPWASQLLGDLGADVVKVEQPGKGDDTRHWGPPWINKQSPSAGSAYFACSNRNKRSIAIDMQSATGRAQLQALAAKADVLVENFKVGTLARYQLDYASLSATNPRLIYCSITGFGQTGPYANRAGYDFIIQAMGGLMSITGRNDEEVGGGPQKVGVALTDILTGMYASVAILAALNERQQSGQGQYIDLALLDVQVACLANQASNYLIGGEIPQRLGNAHPNIVPYEDFPASDENFIIAVGNDEQFTRLCQVLGQADWAGDERFKTNARRVQHRTELITHIRHITIAKPAKIWLQLLETEGIPCGQINNIAQVFADPQILARQMRINLRCQNGELVSLSANPIRYSRSPVSYRLTPPLLGADTESVLKDWLGYDG